MKGHTQQPSAMALHKTESYGGRLFLQMRCQGEKRCGVLLWFISPHYLLKGGGTDICVFYYLS